MATGFKASLIGNGCTSPDGTMVHSPTDKIVTLAEYFAKSEAGRLRDALHGLVDALAENDQDGLTEFAPQMQAARAALQPLT